MLHHELPVTSARRVLRSNYLAVKEKHFPHFHIMLNMIYIFFVNEKSRKAHSLYLDHLLRGLRFS